MPADPTRADLLAGATRFRVDLLTYRTWSTEGSQVAPLRGTTAVAG